MYLSSQASGPKILWIKNNEPEVFRKARWLLTSQAYLVYKLTGKATIDAYTASGYTPYLTYTTYAGEKNLLPTLLQWIAYPKFIGAVR